MRAHLIFTLLFASFVSLNAQDSLKLTFKLDGFKDKDQIRIAFSEGQFNLPTDKPEITISRKLNSPEVMTVVYKSRIQSIWIDNNDIEVYIPKSGFVGRIISIGSPSQMLWDSLLAANKEEKAQILEKNIDHKVAHNFLASRSNLLLPKDAERLLAKTPESIQKTAKYNLNLLELDKGAKLKEGDQMMDFVANTIDGQKVNTNNLRGDFLILDFASTSCGWCWIAYPRMVEIVSEYDNLSVLTFNEDYNYKGWANLAEKREINLPWPVLWEAENKKEIFSKYGINVLPTYLLISPEGKILERWTSGKEEKIKKILDKHNVTKRSSE